ncbi:MAG: hypothetical protein JWN58_308, partial [Gammaproteobacteria bacterium]|nr:hypothetical protein [Gammaproteobacteria bacterium]
TCGKTAIENCKLQRTCQLFVERTLAVQLKKRRVQVAPQNSK